jgi:hypothetical protein
MTTPETSVEETFARCSTCGTLVEAEQRYCLNCGSHRANAHDPVALYLSEASAARARVAAAVQRRAQARRSRRLPRLSPVFATVLVVVALLVGIEIGDSSGGSGSGDALTTSSRSVTSKVSGSGGSAVDQVSKSRGKGYVNQEKSLPTSVTP